jgi:hypothetical protein
MTHGQTLVRAETSAAKRMRVSRAPLMDWLSDGAGDRGRW